MAGMVVSDVQAPLLLWDTLGKLSLDNLVQRCFEAAFFI